MRTRFALLIVASLLSVSACKEKPPGDMVFDEGNNASDLPPPVSTNEVYAAPEMPVANVTNTLPAAPPPAFTDKQQISDDADATGMTARLPSEEAGADANETQPAR